MLVQHQQHESLTSALTLTYNSHPHNQLPCIRDLYYPQFSSQSSAVPSYKGFPHQNFICRARDIRADPLAYNFASHLILTNWCPSSLGIFLEQFMYEFCFHIKATHPTQHNLLNLISTICINYIFFCYVMYFASYLMCETSGKQCMLTDTWTGLEFSKLMS
jgi:hypothetical protein